jgi:predicted nucleic acid-binding protein
MMAGKKVVFVAFAIEDERQRDFLKGQALNTATPFEYIDMSVTEAYEKDWKEKVRTRIKRSDGVIALVSKNSLKSSGQVGNRLRQRGKEGARDLGLHRRSYKTRGRKHGRLGLGQHYQRGLGHAPGLADIIIAATAQYRGLTILSRNLRHLEPLGVAAVDPFVKLPPT